MHPLDSTLLVALICLCAGILAYRRQLRFLHLFQQEEYDNQRFMEWFKREKAFDYGASLLLLLTQLFHNTELAIVTLIGLGGLSYTEPNPTQHARKTLNLTERAIRLLQLSLGMSYLIGIVLIMIAPSWAALAMVIVLQSLPFTLLYANVFLRPYQEKMNQHFLEEAREKLSSLSPTILAITGSFGKTSTKHLLHHILASQFPTLTTPGSVNTPLGISRVIREQLTPAHRFFIAEMGAYGPGSIARLCQLTPPSHAAITGLGEAHYERFKNLETVAQAKFEIAQYTLSRGGKVVLVVDTMQSIHYAQDFIQRYREHLILVGQSPDIPDLDYLIDALKQDEKGLHFELVDLKTQQRHIIQTPIYGLAQCGNIAVAILLAQLSGVPINHSIAALASALQIPHRMQVMTLPNGNILIDNAYNSNPKGFASSLDLLACLAEQNRRRILITPGIVELGEQHHAIHHQLGELAARYVDVLLLINGHRVPTFFKGFTESAIGRLQRVAIQMPTLKDAQEWLGQHGIDGDVVLIENDLPDLYFQWKKR
jgi:UDP-N-acetylmuramoyl-tripeptide--D-alanyl-D-alanine ligase